MEKKEFCKCLYDLYVRYILEIQAEGVWCGHEYATEYLKDFWKETRNFLLVIKGNYYRDVNEYDLNLQLMKMGTDYNDLIDKVYKSDNMTEREIYTVADSLNATFMDILSCGIDLLDQVYTKCFGESFVQTLEKEMCA